MVGTSKLIASCFVVVKINSFTTFEEGKKIFLGFIISLLSIEIFLSLESLPQEQVFLTIFFNENIFKMIGIRKTALLF
jgi:hypothetical protein